MATIAYGMGIDCPNIVIHFGSASSIEDYIQETGRGGRDGLPSTAMVWHHIGSRLHMDDCIKKYIENNTMCRRDVLFSDFDGYSHSDMGKKCSCCDVCATVCNCANCS